MDDLMQMAEEAGFNLFSDGLRDDGSRSTYLDCWPEQLAAFAQLVVQKAVLAEREACAKVCDDKAMHCEAKAQEAIDAGESDEVNAIRSTAWQMSVCAAAIRARSKT